MKRRNRTITIGVLAVIASGLLVTASFYTAYYTLKTPVIQEYIASFGYVGAIALATIAGLNVIVPFPVASLTPMFTAAGMHLPYLVLMFTIGTLIADAIGYWFGRLGRNSIEARYEKTVARLEKIYRERQPLIIPVTFLYAAFMPIPNEVLVIPLAFLGMRWRIMMVPLFFGNLINQSIYTYGIHNVFQFLFL
jgi:membrane protein YqaA with SNARE-associated domain